MGRLAPVPVDSPEAVVGSPVLGDILPVLGDIPAEEVEDTGVELGEGRRLHMLAVWDMLVELKNTESYYIIITFLSNLIPFSRVTKGLGWTIHHH